MCYKVCTACYKVSNIYYKLCNKNFEADSKKYLGNSKKHLGDSKKHLGGNKKNAWAEVDGSVGSESLPPAQRACVTFLNEKRGCARMVIPNQHAYQFYFGVYYLFGLADFGFIFDDNRRTGERRAHFVRVLPSAAENVKKRCIYLCWVGGFAAVKKRGIGNAAKNTLFTKKSAALPCGKATDFVHSQGLEPWTH